MKRLLLLLTLSLTCLALIPAVAEAKRFGGGGSIGKQRTLSSQPAPKAPAAAPAQTAPGATPAAPPSGNKWVGPLAGLAAGLGLAALFSHFGIGEGMGTLLMILLGVGAVMFLLSLFRRQQPVPQYAAAGASVAESRGVKDATVMMPAPVFANSKIPPDFPVDAFLRSAKTSFIRLQAANDRKDLDDIREYTTPEMFAEISMQIRERDNTPQKTDVVSLSAEVLEVVTEGDLAIASVHMSGQLSENGGAAENFDEVWHVQKNLKDDKAVWLLGGIQQIA